jgi:sugar phosphate permease
MGSAISYIKNLKKNLTDKTTYKIVMFMLAGYVLSTLLGGYISDNYIRWMV